MVITTSEAAKAKGVTRAAIHRAIIEGRLVARRSGAIWLIDEEDLAAYTPLRNLAERQARGLERRLGRSA